LLAVARRLDLPRLLRYELLKTVEDAVGIPMHTSSRTVEQLGVRWPGTRSHARGMPRLTELEMLMEVCHEAADDREALDRLCATALQRLRAAAVVVVCARERRVRGHSGRPWDGQSRAVDRALTGGAAGGPVEPLDDHPLEAAEAIRFGGEVIGALAGRWIAGSLVCPERAGATIKSAALAAAAPLRAVLDSAAPSVPDPAWPDLLGSTPEAAALRDTVARAARAPYPVLIEGESGSGKELVARAVHRLGPRRDRRFCAINCAALTDELLEAELFGHTRGAFTGALTERSGLFEDADGGTLFLDEIGELSPRAQAKLLRVIQEGEVRRVGESFARKVDVRIVAATNRRLEEEAAAGRFRTDLRFRLDVIRITVPPLRERASDIPLLAAHFWNDAAARVGSRATLSPEALTALARHDWPGNVRELQNVIAWLAVHSPRRGRIGAAALPRAIAGLAADTPVTFERAREEFERRLIRGALARANGHRARAAASLGVTRQGLVKMMRRLRIDDRPAV
jgi:DNA-binding NtrC family response regulator